MKRTTQTLCFVVLLSLLGHCIRYGPLIFPKFFGVHVSKVFLTRDTIFWIKFQRRGISFNLRNFLRSEIGLPPPACVLEGNGMLVEPTLVPVRIYHQKKPRIKRRASTIVGDAQRKTVNVGTLYSLIYPAVNFTESFSKEEEYAGICMAEIFLLGGTSCCSSEYRSTVANVRRNSMCMLQLAILTVCALENNWHSQKNVRHYWLWKNGWPTRCWGERPCSNFFANVLIRANANFKSTRWRACLAPLIKTRTFTQLKVPPIFAPLFVPRTSLLATLTSKFLN
jgi:hypothetical protein